MLMHFNRKKALRVKNRHENDFRTAKYRTPQIISKHYWVKYITLLVYIRFATAYLRYKWCHFPSYKLQSRHSIYGVEVYCSPVLWIFRDAEQLICEYLTEIYQPYVIYLRGASVKNFETATRVPLKRIASENLRALFIKRIDVLCCPP